MFTITRIDRVRGGLGRGERIVAVTHPAIVRAAVLCALAAPANSFWRIDIPPLTATVLHHRPPAWTLRSTAHELTGRTQPIPAASSVRSR